MIRTPDPRRPADFRWPGVVVLPLLGLLVLAGCATGTGPGARGVDLRVEGRPQARSLSCESRSACDLLAYHGIRVEEASFLAGLPRSDNPELGFVGSVDDPGEGLPPAGYGVYEAPVAARIRALGLPVETHRGRDLAWLRARLDAGCPVLVWATGRLDAPDGVPLTDGSGRRFVAVRGEHTFLATGYAGGRILLLDPALGTTKAVPASRFLASWSTLGRRAIVASECPGS